METNLNQRLESALNKANSIINQNQVYNLELSNKQEKLNEKKIEFQNQTAESLILEKGVIAFNQFTVELTNGVVSHLTNLINQGLEQVFNSPLVKYSIRIDLKARKSNNQADFILIKETSNGVLETKLSDNGFGIQSFVGLILRFYFILQNNLPRVLFIDEGLTAISVNHLPKVKAFLNQLCQKFDFAILLIAHDSDLFDLGDYFYTVNTDGTLEEGVFSE